MELKRVVVTGLGAVTPIGNDVQSFWQGLVNDWETILSNLSIELWFLEQKMLTI